MINRVFKAKIKPKTVKHVLALQTLMQTYMAVAGRPSYKDNLLFSPNWSVHKTVKRIATVVPYDIFINPRQNSRFNLLGRLRVESILITKM